MTIKTKRPSYTTPVGVLSFPCAITEPDTAFADETDPDDKGDYKVRLVLPGNATATKQFLASIQEIMDRHLEETMARTGKKNLKYEADNIPWTMETDRETGEETGNVVIRAKLKAFVRTKAGKTFEQRPKVFDTKNQVLSTPPNIGPGSKVRIAGQVNCWFTSKIGVSLWLEGVQLHELVERGAFGTADSFGFSEAEGYTEEAAFGDAVAGGDF